MNDRIRKVLRAMDGSGFEGGQFPSIEDAQEAGRHLDALEAELAAAVRREAQTREALCCAPVPLVDGPLSQAAWDALYDRWYRGERNAALAAAPAATEEEQQA